MKTDMSAKIGLLIAVVMSSVVYAADDQPPKVTEWVKGDTVTEMAGAGALYAIKPEQLAILEKANPGLKNIQTLAQQADANSKDAYTKASQYKDSFSGVFNHESSARLNEFETLIHKGEYWRAEQRKNSALFKREVEATVQKMKAMPDRALYRRYQMVGVYNKMIRPIGGAVLLFEAVQGIKSIVASSEIKTGQSMAQKSSASTTSLRKPASTLLGKSLPAAGDEQSASVTGSAK